MVPVDSYYIVSLETAREIVDQLSPAIVIPMHYKTDKSHNKAYAEDLERFIKMFDKVKKIERNWLNIGSEDMKDESCLLLLEHTNSEF